MSINFKLTKRGGVTRRISFQELPSWGTLAEKVAGLYSIPLDKVAVSYIDAEDDEVTLSTNEELQDFYQASRNFGEVIKFMVHDLGARSIEDKSLPDTPLTPGHAARNTFGHEAGLPFDIDQDWQNVHIPMSSLFAVQNDSGPHAFVEIVPTDTSSIVSRDESDAKSDFLGPPLDKGKAKAVDPISSTASLLDERVPSKHDLHVFGVSTNSVVAPPSSSSSSSVPTISGPIESTPKVNIQTVNVNPTAKAADFASASPTEVADPPLPTFERPNASLTHDVAALLGMLSTVISSHPELSEGLRNVVRNASDGTYWHTHRETLRRAAEDLSQSATATAQAAEEEAGRRIAEALGNIFRAVANVVGPYAHSETAEPVQDTEAQANSRGPWGSWRGPRSARYPGWYSGIPFPPFGPPPPPGRRGPFPPPPPPGGLMADGWSSFWGGTPSAPPPPPPPAPPADHEAARPRESPQDLRAQVEAAKLLYKAEKERYRQEREERKKEKERQRRLLVDAPEPHPQQAQPMKASNTLPPPATQIVSNARGSYPQLEMFNVPRRHNTLPSSFGRVHGHQTHASESSAHHESPSARASARINKKLADMGFTESAHPDLPSKIKAQLSQSGASISKENEDDIVTNLLEELIVTSPKQPHASSSGLKRKDDIPGAWN